MQTSMQYTIPTPRSSLVLCGLLILGLLAACGDDSGPSAPDLGTSDGIVLAPDGLLPAPDTLGPDADATSYELRVSGGFGGGHYAPGTVVHVFADLRPQSELLMKWEGDAELLEEPKEWHSTLIMPARTVELRAVVEPRAFAPQEMLFEGSTTVDKVVRYVAPAEPQGVILMCHGTSGSSDLLLKEESIAFAQSALARGFAVVAMDAEEAAIMRAELAAGTPREDAEEKADIDDNGKIRWHVGLIGENVDLANVDALLVALSQRWPGLDALPRHVMGMSNGGAFALALGAVAATPEVAARYPRLRFAAAVSYCASGREGQAEITQTPTAWLMCAQDLNEQVSNDKARANSALLAARQIRTLYDEHQPSPLYDARLTRVGDLETGINLDPQTSAAIVDELRNAGFLDAEAMLLLPPDAIVVKVKAAPKSFPTLMSLPVEQLARIRLQLKVCYADHGFYADWSERALDFMQDAK